MINRNALIIKRYSTKSCAIIGCFGVCLPEKESENLLNSYVSETTPVATAATTNTATPFSSYLTTGSYFCILL